MVSKAVLLTTVLSGGRLPGFTQRKSVSIDNSSGAAQTNYQVKVSVTFATGMNADFSDVRFTDADGRTQLSYWRQEYVASTSAVFWVKLASLPLGVKKIWLYYGNALALTTSDGTGVFDFFDDFDANLDAGKWTETNTNSNCWTIPRPPSTRLFNAGSGGGQGLYGDGTNIFFGKNNGSGVDGTIYKYDYAGSLATSFAAPAHAASIDARADTGNLITSTGSTEAPKVWEITKAGVKVREWDFTGVDYGRGAMCAYRSAGKIWLFTSDASNNFKVRSIAINNDGSYTAESEIYSSASLGVPQGLVWKDGFFWYCVDDPTGGLGSIYKLRLNADGSLTTVFRYINLLSAEREGLSFDGTNWLYGTFALDVYQVDLSEGNVLEAHATITNNIFAHINSVATFATPCVVGARAKLRDSRYPMVVSMSDGNPTAGNNMFGLGKLASADAYLYGRQRSSSTQTQQAYTGTTNMTSYQNYEAVWQGGTVRYYQNGSALGVAVSGNVPAGPLSVSLGGGTFTGGTGFDAYYPWVYVRKYQATEPSVTIN